MMNKKIIIILMGTLLIASVIAFGKTNNYKTVSIGEIKDQYQEIDDGYNFISTNEWQEFKPTIEKLVRVEVKIGQYYEGSPPLKLSIEKPLGAILTSKELPANLIPSGGNDWVSFDIPDYNLVPGNIYYIKLTAPLGSEYSWCYGGGNPYPVGVSSKGATFDWCFRTYLIQEGYNVDLNIKPGIGLGVNVEITNNGDEPITEQLNCKFEIKASLMIMGDENVQLTPQPQPPSSSQIINSGFVLGLGKTDISVSLTPPYPPYNVIAEDTATGLTLGPIIWVRG